MDLRSLVDRIATALGPDVSPARVEAVAEAVLDALEAPPAGMPFARREPGERIIITAYGYDQPGVLARITERVSGAGCNILDVSQKILQGYFTLIMLADIGALRGSVKELQAQLSAVADELGVRVMVQHEDLFNAMHRV